MQIIEHWPAKGTRNKEKRFCHANLHTKVNKPLALYMVLAKLPRQDMIGIKCNLILASKMVKRKAKHIFPPRRPYLGQMKRRKREEKSRTKTKPSLILCSLNLSANPLHAQTKN